jgi:TRAP-type mannitol/chloroaromatic compound transport system permease small subunit
MTTLLRTIAHAVSWLSLALILLMVVDVVLRYVFRISHTWMIDLEWHLFAVVFLWGASATWLDDKHVRVDLFYARWSPRRKAWVNILGTIFFLIPWCVMIILVTAPYAWSSWSIREGSPDPGGLPARYLIKIALLIGYVLLLLAALVRLRLEWRVVVSPPQEMAS